MLNLALISPLLAMATASIFGLSPELAVGLVLLGASPGGMMANMLTHLSRGRHGAFGDDDRDQQRRRDRHRAALPRALGRLLRRRRRRRREHARRRRPRLRDHDRPGRDRDGPAPAPSRSGSQEVYPRVRNVSLALFALVVFGAIASEHDTVAENAAEVGGAALALNLAAMSISFAISKLARLDDRQATAIALELGIHNAALAIAVGASLATEVTIPAAVYASFMLFTGGAFAWAMSRRNALAAPGPRADHPFMPRRYHQEEIDMAVGLSIRFSDGTAEQYEAVNARGRGRSRSARRADLSRRRPDQGRLGRPRLLGVPRPVRLLPREPHRPRDRRARRCGAAQPA